MQDASRPDVHLAERQRRVPRPEPASEVLGIGPGLEDELARGSEDASEDELLLRGVNACVACVHAFSPSSASASTARSDRSSPPRSGGSASPTPPPPSTDPHPDFTAATPPPP